jgi:hypothetical protein
MADVMYAIVERFAQLVATPPDPVIAASRVGAHTPATQGDLPTIVVSLAIDDQRTTGLGRVTRSGEMITRHSAIVPVQEGPETFSPDLRRLRLSPLPIRKNPASTSRQFSADDLAITNVSDATHPIAYQYLEQPAGPHDYAIDPVHALVNFGGAQTAADTLHVVHWTVTWRDDIEGAAYRGLLNADLWGASIGDVTTLSQKRQDRLVSPRTLMRQLGFSRLQSAGLTAAAQLLHAPSAGSPFPCWRLPLAYRFAFELEWPAEDSSAGPITRIDVNFTGAVHDTLAIPRPSS